MALMLDHIVWASPDLDVGAELLAAVTGVAPVRGGSHPGFGTRNCLLGLGLRLYFELMAPNPAQSLDGNRGGALAALPGPGLLTFVVRTDDLDDYERRAAAAGVRVGPPVSMERTRPDGRRLAWTCRFPADPELGDLVPFAIDWHDTPHPSETLPPGLRLLSLEALHPRPDRLRAIYAALGLDVAVRSAPRAGLMARLDSPAGEVVLLPP